MRLLQMNSICNIIYALSISCLLSILFLFFIIIGV